MNACEKAVLSNAALGGVTEVIEEAMTITSSFTPNKGCSNEVVQPDHTNKSVHDRSNDEICKNDMMPFLPPRLCGASNGWNQQQYPSVHR